MNKFITENSDNLTKKNLIDQKFYHAIFLVNSLKNRNYILSDIENKRN
jgi:hypothetical protein